MDDAVRLYRREGDRFGQPHELTREAGDSTGIEEFFLVLYTPSDAIRSQEAP